MSKDPRDLKKRDNLPANPYPMPKARLVDRAGYPANGRHLVKLGKRRTRGTRLVRAT